MTPTAQTTLPPGRYWIGDPYFAVPDHLWHEFLNSVDPTSGLTVLGPHHSAVYNALIQDRPWHQATDERAVTCETGTVAALAAAMARDDPGTSSLKENGFFIDSPSPLLCSRLPNGTITFGPTAVFTGNGHQHVQPDTDRPIPLARAAMHLYDSTGEHAMLEWLPDHLSPSPPQTETGRTALLVLADHSAIMPTFTRYHFLWTPQPGDGAVFLDSTRLRLLGHRPLPQPKDAACCVPPLADR